MACTPQEIATITQQLSEARAAYHDLMTGNAVSVSVDQNGERVEYSRANANALFQYIVRLQSTLTAGSCNAFQSATPTGFYF